MSDDDEKSPDNPRSAAPLSPSDRQQGMQGLAAGYVMIASVLVGLGIGYLIDRFAGTAPVWTVIMSLLFIIVGIYNLARETRK